MPSSELPPFEPVTLDELRRIWSAHDDPDIRRLALEVARYCWMQIKFHSNANDFAGLAGKHPARPASKVSS